jgi:Domain of unknown function (DUF4177)
MSGVRYEYKTIRLRIGASTSDVEKALKKESKDGWRLTPAGVNKTFGGDTLIFERETQR